MLDNFLFRLNIILTKLSYYTDYNITDNKYSKLCMYYIADINYCLCD